MAVKRISVEMTAAQVRFLEKRGARAHRGPGATFSRSVVLGRMLDYLRMYQESSDPRRTRGLPEPMYQVLVRRLPEPWTLRRLDIETLEAFLARSAKFMAAVEAAKVAPAALLAAVEAMSLAEKVTLVDHAVQVQAPAAAGASPEEP
jgi:hypothetical protein